MICICEKVRLQQLREAKYSILASILHNFLFFFFLAEPLTYLYNILYKSHDFLHLALNLGTFFKKCDFLKKFVLSFSFEQGTYIC